MLNSMMIFFFLGVVSCAVLPVEKCKLEDSQCLKREIQKAVPIYTAGIPEHGVEVLDVMELDTFKFDLAGLKFSLTDGRVKGLKNSVIDDIKWDFKGKKFEILFHVDCTVKGNYTADGNILVLPITGEGESNLELKNLELKLVIKYSIEKRDGKEYVVPSSYTYKYEVKDGAHFDLTNLFNGNKELSDTMLLFLNENWKEITQQFGSPLIEKAGNKIFNSMKGFFAKEPINDISLM